MMTRILYTGLFLIGVLLGAFPVSAADQQPSDSFTNKPTCSGSLQALIDLAAPGSILLLDDNCIYREHVTIDKPLVLDGQGVAEIRGSDVWGGWTPADGVWVSQQVVPLFSSHGECNVSSDGRCLWPEQVFYNGSPLRQVATGAIPSQGQFALDGDRRIVLADDPAGAFVEVSVRDRWMTLVAETITVRQLAMRHAAADSQTGGLEIDHAPNWVVENCDLSHAHGANLYVHNAPGGLLVGSVLHHGGQLGMGAYSHSITIRDNHFHSNNTEDFAGGWEAGGMKITRSQDVVIESNDVDTNLGTGIWCDIDCVDVTIRDNAVHHNAGVGIMFEISDGAEIYGNRVWENGRDPDRGGWAYDSGILIASSRNARVYDNVVAWNGDGISVISQCRAYLDDGVSCDLKHPWNSVFGNEVFNNVIIMTESIEADTFALAWLCDIFVQAGEVYSYPFTPEAGNRGVGNAIWIPDNEGSTNIHFAWAHRLYDLDGFSETPGGEESAFLDVAQRDEILKDAGIPLLPAEIE